MSEPLDVIRRALVGLLTLAAGLAEELLLTVALGLIVWGLWPVAGQVAWTVPGVVLLWIVMPQRKSLVARPTPAPTERRKTA